MQHTVHGIKNTILTKMQALASLGECCNFTGFSFVCHGRQYYRFKLENTSPGMYASANVVASKFLKFICAAMHSPGH